MPTSQVDVIIPCYNGAEFLPNSISSVLAQTYDRVNLLVVDDGSTDHTRATVKSLGRRVGYFFQKNRGLPGARNAGVLNTNGDYICFLDADDIILPHMIEEQAAYLDAHPDVDICHARTLIFDGPDIDLPYAEQWRPHVEWESYLEAFSVICAFHLCSAVFRRRVFERVGLFPENMEAPGCEDWAFLLESLVQGAKIKYIPRVHALYRQHYQSMSSADNVIAERESALMRYAADLFDRHNVVELRKREILSLGIKSIAARWKALGENNRFADLVRLAERVRRPTEAPNGKDFFRPDTDLPASMLYLALSKSFFDLGLPELSVVMFLKPLEIRFLLEDAAEFRQLALFETVLNIMEDVADKNVQTPRRGNRRRYEPLGSPDGDPGYFLKLDRAIPHDASFYGHLTHQLALLQFTAGRVEEAERAVRESIELNPNFKYARLDLVKNLIRQGLPERARSAFNLAIELEPDRAHVKKRILFELELSVYRILGRRMRRRIRLTLRKLGFENLYWIVADWLESRALRKIIFSRKSYYAAMKGAKPIDSGGLSE